MRIKNATVYSAREFDKVWLVRLTIRVIDRSISGHFDCDNKDDHWVRFWRIQKTFWRPRAEIGPRGEVSTSLPIVPLK